MSCVNPVQAYMHMNEESLEGKKVIKFSQGFNKEEWRPIKLPCGRCDGCRIARSKDWAVRAMNEASLFEHNCFITLTYNEASVDRRGSLIKSDFQNFMKRLRKNYAGIEEVNYSGKTTSPIRFLHCGEYGDLMDRPHHHACLFNFDFPDRYHWRKNGEHMYDRSDILEELWSKEVTVTESQQYDVQCLFTRKDKLYAKLGHCEIGDLTYGSAAYVAAYVTKKVTGIYAPEHYARYDEQDEEWYYLEPEYITMSRRPGIGKWWYEKYGKTDLFPKDFLTVNGVKHKVPKYYDSLKIKEDPEEMEGIKEKRMKVACSSNRYTESALAARKEIMAQKVKAKKRSLYYDV